jgi:type 2 lantibiotic biosynthesis protein LanM
MESQQIYTNNNNQTQEQIWANLKYAQAPEARLLCLLIPQLTTMLDRYEYVRNKNKQLKKLLPKNILRKIIKAHAKSYIPKIIKFLIVEYHNCKESGILTGSSTRELFSCYIEKLETTEFRQYLFEKYPILKERLDYIFDVTIKSNIELFERLGNDWHDIKTQLLQNKNYKIHNITPAGDPHRQGNTVCIITLRDTNKNTAKIVYKPSALSTDFAYNKLIEWFNKKSSIKLSYPTILFRQSHAWCEFITYESCNTEKELSLFYTRMGTLTMILYLINGVDIHCENLIANQSFPVPIDLECILKPYITSKNYLKNPYITVLETAIFPNIVKFSDYTYRDASVLTGYSDNYEEKPKLQFSSKDNHEIKLTYTQIKQQSLMNIPMLNNQHINNPEHFIENIVEGFELAYTLLLKEKKYLQSSASTLQQFKKIHGRYLFRPTCDYNFLIHESFHPAVMNAEDNYNQYFSWLNHANMIESYYDKIIPSELNDILYSDIPYFYYLGDSKTIFDSQDKSLKISIQKSGFDTMMDQVNKLSQNDLLKQIYLIRMSMDTYLINKQKPIGKNIIRSTLVYSKSSPPDASIIHSLISTTFSILDKQKFITDTSITWPLLESHENDQLYIAFSNDSFFSGTSGIMLTYYYAGLLLKQPKYTMIGDQCYQQLISNILNDSTSIAYDQLGAYRGIGGILYVLAVIDLLNIKKLTPQIINNLTNRIEPLIDNDLSFDIFAGSAGLLLLLTKLPNQIQIPNTKTLEAHLAKHILTHWPDPTIIPKNMTLPLDSNNVNIGFAHGIPGIILALASYNKTTKDPIISQWINKALDLLLESLSNQPQIDKPLWCNSYVGLAIACLELKSIFNDSRIDALLNIALQHTLRICCTTEYDSLNMTYCCGLLGANDLLLTLLQQDQTQISRTIIYEQLNKTINILEENNISNACFASGSHAPINQGTSGIAYFLLRLLYSEKIPSILSLSLP